MIAALNTQTAIGLMRLEESDEKLTGVFLPQCFSLFLPDTGGSPFLRKVKTELDEYFRGKRTEFDLPFKLSGSVFQQKVLMETAKIPYGNTLTYSEIANRIGSPNAARAVGTALHKNPIAIVIPCHRVIGTGKKLVGFGGGIPLKKFLLQLEHGYAGDNLCF